VSWHFLFVFHFKTIAGTKITRKDIVRHIINIQHEVFFFEKILSFVVGTF